MFTECFYSAAAGSGAVLNSNQPNRLTDQQAVFSLQIVLSKAATENYF